MIRHGSLLALLMVVFLGVEAKAQWVFSPSLYYYSIETKPSGSESTSTKIHARLGYKFGAWLYGGGIYETEKVSSNGTTVNEMTAYGPSIGLVGENWFGILHYLIQAEYGSPGGSKYVEGTGPQVDVGYQFALNGTFGLAPQLVYRSIKWKKSETGGSSTSADLTRTEIFPMIALFVMF
jgi:hypothetical protein